MLARLIAIKLHAVAPLDEREALGDKPLELDGADFTAILFALATPLRLFVIVELALDPLGGEVEEIDRRP
jgi:hypothetical protein